MLRELIQSSWTLSSMTQFIHSHWTLHLGVELSALHDVAV